VGIAFGEALFELDHPCGLRGGLRHAGEASRRGGCSGVAAA
jgi:hypothetical protein